MTLTKCDECLQQLDEGKVINVNKSVIVQEKCQTQEVSNSSAVVIKYFKKFDQAPDCNENGDICPECLLRYLAKAVVELNSYRDFTHNEALNGFESAANIVVDQFK